MIYDERLLAGGAERYIIKQAASGDQACSSPAAAS